MDGKPTKHLVHINENDRYLVLSLVLLDFFLPGLAEKGVNPTNAELLSSKAH